MLGIDAFLVNAKFHSQFLLFASYQLYVKAMYRTWIESSRDSSFRASALYKQEINNFIDYAFSNAAVGEEILCPCIKCINQVWQTRKDVFEHLVLSGFLRSYTCWTLHGEVTSSHSPPYLNLVPYEEGETIDATHNMLTEILGRNAHEGDEDGNIRDDTNRSDVETVKFNRLLEDANKELYPGNKKFTKLSFIIQLYHIKCLYKFSDKAFSELLKLIKEALPDPNTLPNSLYDTKKIIKDLGLNYNKIDACPNDCMLYWKEAANAKSCLKCGT